MLSSVGRPRASRRDSSVTSCPPEPVHSFWRNMRFTTVYFDEPSTKPLAKWPMAGRTNSGIYHHPENNILLLKRHRVLPDVLFGAGPGGPRSSRAHIMERLSVFDAVLPPQFPVTFQQELLD